jgi:hypothetical protein
MIGYAKLVANLKQIKEKNYIKTHRTGNTGIGKTLEDELSIKENNVPGPNGFKLELKSTRKNSKSMLTLFTKSPLPKKANSVLLNKFGYPSKRGNGKKELHTTINAVAFNTLKGKEGFKIKICNDKIEILTTNGASIGYWDKESLQKSFERKLPRLMYVKADVRGKGLEEEFWFNEAWVLKGFDFKNFLRLIGEGTIFVDIRIGQYNDGRAHDHGTAFRVFPDKLELCFSHREQIM